MPSNKFHLLKLLNADTEETRRLKQRVIADQETKKVLQELNDHKETIKHLKGQLETIKHSKSILYLNDEISKLTAGNRELQTLLNDYQKKNTCLKKETLSHSILELNNANIKHNERIALMEKEIIAASDFAQETDAQNQRQREMTLKYQKQIANYVLDTRITQELENISLHTMNVKILDKLNIAHNQFLPDQLEEDINRLINKQFSDDLFKLAESSYANALSRERPALPGVKSHCLSELIEIFIQQAVHWK